MDVRKDDSSINVLYVDDEPFLLEICKIFLEMGGQFRVDTFPSAMEALKILEVQRYDAIISDYQMPYMDGIEFLRTLRAKENTTPFIIFTGKGREEVVIDALNSGVDAYVQKGGDPNAQFVELSHKIKQIVRRQRAESELASNREYLDKILHSVKAGIVVLDAESHIILDANPAAVELIETPKEKIIGKICHEFICPNEVGKCPISNLGKDMDNSERILITADGREIPVIKYVTRIELNGRACLLETFIDNTKRKKAEEELQRKNEELCASYQQIAAAEEELQANMEKMVLNEIELKEKDELYQLFFKTSQDSVFIITPEGDWRDFNEALITLWGYENRGELMEAPLSSFFADPAEHERLLKTVEDKGFLKDFPMKFRKKDGYFFDALITIASHKKTDGTIKGFVGTVKKVPDRVSV